MKSTSNTIDSVLQQQSSPGSSSSEDRDHRGYTTGCGKTSVTRSKHAGVQVNKSNVRDQYEISSQTHSEVRLKWKFQNLFRRVDRTRDPHDLGRWFESIA